MYDPPSCVYRCSDLSSLYDVAIRLKIECIVKTGGEIKFVF